MPTRKLTKIAPGQKKMQSVGAVRKVNSTLSKNMQIYKSSKWNASNIGTVEVKISEADSFNESESDFESVNLNK